MDDEWKEEVSISNADDVLSVIKSDYEKAYFVTGIRFYVFLIDLEVCNPINQYCPHRNVLCILLNFVLS